ncbi:TonB-dependent receptor plug domain-containing protein [Sphingomonas mucosissima]|uniref:Colicin I receptor n=1 Tax=Sphingomonas mucosissima TaxID=370959 RepID=A0A245ZDR9_9SPHN|nr:TonB-dependent receptor [Sphingomonas mucosissima]OWK27853.1 colicin I receptor precursor [Sphingomonas mucosissima]
MMLPGLAPAEAKNLPASDAASIGDDPGSLLDMSLEDLLSLESTSVAKKRQRVQDSAAAVYVITQEDIRRSAASSIPELLRQVPGVEVGVQQNGGYAISIRGFNSRLANSLLVMVDGRSIYVSTLSGTFWDQLMIPLGDLERIEVVRGPGATLWGANAVNGVINIITKHSAATLGASADARVSTRRQEASLSWGDRLTETLSYRLHANWRREKGPQYADGSDLARRWIGKDAGLRVDWEPDTANAVTLQGGYGDGRFDAPFNFISADYLEPGYVQVQTENDFNAWNVLGRWTHQSSKNLDLSLQATFDQVGRSEFDGLRLHWQQAAIDAGLRWKASDRHELNMGVGTRIMRDTLSGCSVFYCPSRPKNTDRWVSGYIQDDITLVPDRLRLTIGTKVEDNNFTGFEIQPSARLFFRASPSVALWGGVSRAVRTPSRFERDAVMSITVMLPGEPQNPFPLPLYGRYYGQPTRAAEELLAWEAGTRVQLPHGWALDVAGYYNDYQKIGAVRLLGTAPIFVAPYPVPVGIQVDGQMQGLAKTHTWGAEAVLTGRLSPWWKVEATWSHFDYSVEDDPLTGQPHNLIFPLEGSPRNQLGMRNSMDFGERASLDTQLRYVSSVAGGMIPAYVGGDVRLTYRPFEGVELSMVGENLFGKRRAEFTQPYIQAPIAYVPRSVSIQARARF